MTEGNEDETEINEQERPGGEHGGRRPSCERQIPEAQGAQIQRSSPRALRTSVSYLATLPESNPVRRPATTNRYTHLDDATLRKAAERTAVVIEPKLRHKDGRDPVVEDGGSMTTIIESDDLTSVSGLRSLGFRGFRTVASLRLRGLDVVPAEPGVYLFLRNGASPPRFRAVGTGGHFKGRDPNVYVSRLTAEWVDDALIVYVGQSGSGSQGTLRKRIGQMVRFGEGYPVGHWGGRLVWQLQDAEELQICWQTTQDDNPRDVEKELIHAFKSFHEGRRPLANLRD